MAEKEVPQGIEQTFTQAAVNRLVSEGNAPEIRHAKITIIQMNALGDESVGREARSYVSVRTGEETRVVRPDEAEVIKNRLEIAQRKVDSANQLREAIARFGSENPLKHRSRSGGKLY